ncbi:hypothetical protein [Streptomyces sp. NBC_00197]|uniref:hypothetical protein n=1 Tax=Streptomyces sp. NBC_00197 TaxID=2975676 RepID=UPI00324D347A
MSIFYIYVPDGGGYSMIDMEYSPNTESVKRQLASRVRTGKGVTRFVRDMEDFSYSSLSESACEDEWPEATDEAQMVVWRTKDKVIPTGNPTEVWWFSGNTDRPDILPVSDEYIPKQKARVPDDVIARRLAMGWDEEKARSTPLAARSGAIQPEAPKGFGTMNIVGNERRITSGLILHTAFGMSKTLLEWHQLTRIGEGALRAGIARHGLEEYLRKKQWYPGRRS